MNQKDILKLFEEVRDGKIDPVTASKKLSAMPFQSLSSSKIDTHRELRTGMPEVIFGLNKTDKEIVDIAEKILEAHGKVLATRISKTAGGKLKKKFPDAVVNDQSKIFWLDRKKNKPEGGTVVVISAGTSDMPIAEEASITAEACGRNVERIYDVGVSGLHRLIADDDRIRNSAVKVVAAGMEGALPSVVAGIYGGPVIGVPTSVGYGVSTGGFAALFSMLSSCAPGIAVVNIDNGFGAGLLAAQIAGLVEKK